jgi:EF hand
LWPRKKLIASLVLTLASAASGFAYLDAEAKAFTKADRNGDGMISIPELKAQK